MKEEQFNKVISDLVISLEKAGVYTPELKSTIDNLFNLKDLVLVRDAGKEEGTCFRCSNYQDGFCTFISGAVTETVKIELTPPNKDRVKIQVPKFFSCKFYKA